MVWPLWDVLREEGGQREGRAVPFVSPAAACTRRLQSAAREARGVEGERGTCPHSWNINLI